ATWPPEPAQHRLPPADTEPVVTSGASEAVPRVLPGDPQNLSDVDAFNLLLEMKLKRRRERPNLPRTVTELVAEDGSRVYVVGTAHFSDDSKRDVVKYRVSMLKMDERTLLREAKEISLEKLQQAVRQNGVASGLMQMLLLKVSAHITEQLGVAPGGEFREAFKEASRVPFCKFHLGDRPIPVTFKRAIAALSLWQKVKLAWGLCRLPGPPGLRPLLDRAPRRQPAPGPARRPALPAEALRRLAAQVAAQTSRRVLAEGPPRRGPGPALPARPQPAQIKESVHCLSSGLPAAPPPCPSPVGC
uniref:TraB domain containing n=1 Tax=Capra hircus TaxID=9925 RepID=A0A8C2P2E0_CAPHI